MESLPASSDPLLHVRGLAKRFTGGRGIHDVNITVPAGCVTGFIGTNGAGKSTTLRCILGLLKPDSGEVRLFGRAADPSTRHQIGFLPEERGLVPHDRARDAIAFQGRLKGMDRRNAFRAADYLLERIGLGGRERSRVETLSKGNAQRVQILCALVHKPRLLVLDEPLSGLDPVAQAEMSSLFAEFRSRGGGILFSTHSMAAAESICDSVVMLAHGGTVFEGLIAEASHHAPHGAMVVTSDSGGLAVAAASIGAQVHATVGASGDAQRWRVVMPRDITHPALLRALAQHNVPIFTFQPIQANLEGAFWDLAAGAKPESPLPAERWAA